MNILISIAKSVKFQMDIEKFSSEISYFYLPDSYTSIKKTEFNWFCISIYSIQNLFDAVNTTCCRYVISTLEY